MSLLLRGGCIVDTDGEVLEDLLVEGTRITARATSLDVDADLSIDVSGLKLLPTALDAHVHFRWPGYEEAEEWETAAKAALAGGVTAVLDMPNNRPTVTTPEAIEAKAAHARGKGLDFGFFIAATEENAARLSQVVPPAVGVKLFCAPTTDVAMPSDPAVWRKVIACGKTVAVHAEDGRLLEAGAQRSKEVALSALRELLPAVLDEGGRMVVCHVTSPEELDLIDAYREKGAEVFVEVSPHHLLLSVDDELGPWGKVNPPLRSRQDNRALIEALAQGRIDLVASDHAPHPRALKGRPSPPSGMPGVGTLMPALLTLAAEGKIPYTRIPELTAAGPAKAYGLAPRGRLAVGDVADLVLVEPDGWWKLAPGDLRCGKCGWSAFAGIRFRGKILATLRGESALYLDQEKDGWLAETGEVPLEGTWLRGS